MILISIITLNVAPLKITHLAFAGDLMLFTRGDVMSVKILLDCLSKFGLVSGLRLNILKSSLYTAGIHGQLLEDILELTNVPRGSMPFRYLGIPLASGKLKISCYASFLDKITTYIGAWNCFSLSYVRKVELIRAVLQGVKCFWLFIFPILATIILRIVSHCQKFLWGSKKPLVAWKDLCLPKEKGGLDLKDLKSWNLALLAKSLWNIQRKKDTLSIRWVHQVYRKGACIWEISPRKEHSPLFKKLLDIINLLLQRILNLSTAQNRDLNMGENIGRGQENLDSSMGLQTAQTGGQNLGFLDSFFIGEMGAKFSTKMAYRLRGTKKFWAADVWKAYITLKHSFLLWLGAQSKLLAKYKLLFLDIDRMCEFCGHKEEMVHRLFFECSSLRHYGEILLWLGIRKSMSTLASALKWLKKETRVTSWLSMAKRIALASTVYYIWLTCNRKIFEDLSPNLDCVVRRIKTHAGRVIGVFLFGVILQAR
ncbi:uncharacterized protein LOC111411376 [Olea europaea var. sylvestris]|uniref:uncharacterized protein LOC111411376 n=1 Tax=Olea europaea var. sylvestris TaxID=158386 RepID=UPI000C1CD03A|nr:uncharacterized protein LOC111411376 [Olea europaea var. sylvestris]